MRALVLGYGSIGARHTRLLGEAQCSVAVLSRRSIDVTPCYSELAHALSNWKPEYVVVAARTSEHHLTLDGLIHCGFRGRVLVEKPLFDRALPLPPHNFSLAVVAYNLRCHPLLVRLKTLLENAGGLVAANVYVGSYLPAWRPNRDYRQSYSASREQGGGALRDLSHEIDYTQWLLGSWRRLTASGGHVSDLDIDSDDAYTLLMETQRCPLITIHLNYLDRVPRREIIVHTNRHSIRVDFIKNMIVIDGDRETVSVMQDDTYRAEHQAMLTGDVKALCTLEEGLETILTIEAAERAAVSHVWITR